MIGNKDEGTPETMLAREDWQKIELVIEEKKAPALTSEKKAKIVKIENQETTGKENESRKRTEKDSERGGLIKVRVTPESFDEVFKDGSPARGVTWEPFT